MKRLTKWIDNGTTRYAVPITNIKIVGYDQCCTRLAEYEDTGMTPEQIKEMQIDWVAMKAASEMYRKEKAERPDIYGDGYDRDGNLVCDEWYCPRCSTRYEIGYGHYNYCPNCGQKIDWSDEDEK